MKQGRDREETEREVNEKREIKGENRKRQIRKEKEEEERKQEGMGGCKTYERRLNI